MADQRVKKRSWGKTKQREEITIINHEKIEETLQKLAEEAKTSQSNEQKDGNTVNSGSRSSGVDLQYPELMSNDALIAALKRIKVPIPVYPDGTPSRERLLYLYKTNVMPRPQRNSWTRGRQRRKASKEDAVGVMEVDQEDDGAGWNETSTSNMIPQRKRCALKGIVNIMYEVFSSSMQKAVRFR